MTATTFDEFARADLGDARRTKRLILCAQRWSADPSASFPDMMDDDAELQGIYGFFENDAVDYREVLRAHVDETLRRIDAVCAGTVLVLEDTTSFAFGGATPREGMGWLGKEQQGFFAHFALAVSADGARRPLGVVGLQTRMRPRPTGVTKSHDGRKTAHDPKRESLRWRELASEVNNVLRGHAIPIHVMDCEADSFDTFGSMHADGARFVVRVRELKRPVFSGEGGGRFTVRAAALRGVPMAHRSAKISRRVRSKLPGVNLIHPPREEREAKLEFAATRVRIDKPGHLRPELPASIDVNLVHVREVDGPDDAEPIEWLLYTTETISAEADVLRIVDIYRTRWLIEEFFKAIKTGCGYEKRQLGSSDALLIALAMCAPIAWQLLAIRTESRLAPNAPAVTLMSRERLDALRLISKRVKLGADPTVIEVLYAIAGRGGHLRRNGPPGWQTLRKGMEKLLFAEHVLAMHRENPREI
jgi:hypothetical protein